MSTQQKIFIIGLPRTATTSICVAMLSLDYTVAHTSYTQACFHHAQVIADTPIFNDYQALDKAYPGAKFINLQRDLTAWVPSIKQLLQRMYINVTATDGGFNPHIKRCFSQTFSPFTRENINNDDFLTRCYEKHQQQISNYFRQRPNDLLNIDISTPNSYTQLIKFLGKADHNGGFERINVGGKVTAWNKIRHPNKIDSTKKGRIDKHLGYLEQSANQYTSQR